MPLHELLHGGEDLREVAGREEAGVLHRILVRAPAGGQPDLDRAPAAVVLVGVRDDADFERHRAVPAGRAGQPARPGRPGGGAGPPTSQARSRTGSAGVARPAGR